MEQIGRHKTKYTSPHTSVWSTDQTTDARVSPDAYWKYTQRRNQNTSDKSTRRHQNPMPESTTSYYTSANSYNTFKHNAYPCSTHPKHSSVLHTEVPQRYQQSTVMKSSRNNDRPNNVVVNKDRYKTQQEDENNTDYIDEGNFTEDNLEEDAEEEGINEENSQSLRRDKRIGESINKEYDEQEADDEIDEESDAPAETQAIQRNAVKKDALLRAQRMRIINQQQDPQRIYYQQSPKLYQAHHLPTRYYHHTIDHDIHGTLSEEDMYTAHALKNSSRRLSTGYQNWIPQKSSADRYDTMTSLTQPSRRARTRSEIKSFTEAEFADRRKCSRCGNISTRKPSTSRRNQCRFQDNPNFSTKTRFGGDAEIFDQSWCGHCKPKHHFERNIGPCEIPSPILYSMKSRRSRDTNVPMHEMLDEKHPIDEISHEFARMPSRYTKDMSNTLRDKTRHSMTAQDATRISARYNS